MSPGHFLALAVESEAIGPDSPLGFGLGFRGRSADYEDQARSLGIVIFVDSGVLDDRVGQSEHLCIGQALWAVCGPKLASRYDTIRDRRYKDRRRGG